MLQQKRQLAEEKVLVISHKLILVNKINFVLRAYREKIISFGTKDMYIRNKIISYDSFLSMPDTEAEKVLIFTVLSIDYKPEKE